MGHQTVALTVEAPSLHVFGRGGTNVQTSYEGAGSASTNVAAYGSFVAQTPLRVAIGTGYEASWGSAELNVSFHAPVARAYEAEVSGSAVESRDGKITDRDVSLALSARSRGVVNIGVGGEVFLTPRISFLGGVSTDLSSVPKGALSQDPLAYYPAHTNRVAASFGYGSHGEGGDLLIGGEFALGWGERLAVNPYQLPPRLDTADERSYSFLFVLAGSTSLKAIKRAVEDVSRESTKPEHSRPRETEKMKTDLQTDAVAAPPSPAPVPRPEPVPPPAPPKPREPPPMRSPSRPR
jgi:hypothetical protein